MNKVKKFKDNCDMSLNSIECIFYDFDGVMTDNRVLVDETGKEAVFVNRSDGYAVSKLKEIGITQAIISTEKNPVVVRRAEKIDIPVINGVGDKGKVIIDYAKENNIDLTKSIFIGNDLNDLPAFEVVGYKGCPKDAAQEILGVADWISSCNGGYGVIRDFYSFISR